MGAGGIFLLFTVIAVVAIVVGALYAIRAGLWVRETSPKTSEPRGDGQPENVRVEDEGNVRFDTPEHERGRH
jgi:hypothetical protein